MAEPKSIKGNFEGYIWKSDQQAPQIYKGENLLNNPVFSDDENPFTIEGQLYDRNTGHSVSIKYVDGKYMTNEYYIKHSKDGQPSFYKDSENKEAIKGELKELHYKGNSKLEGNNLHFYELWEAKEDRLCCRMEVLKPTKVFFAGFE